MNPLVLASLHTLDASHFVLFKVHAFGTVTYMADDDGYVHKCIRYKGKTYYASAMPDVKRSAFDYVVGLVRSTLAVLGAFGLALHLGLYFGGFYTYLAQSYPDNEVLSFLTIMGVL